MVEASKCEDITKLFTVIARKNNISIILIVQNIYQQGSQFRNIRLNATGIVLFKFYGGQNANHRLLRNLGMSSLVPKMLFDNIYADRYKYIYLDLHPNRQYEYSSARGNIFDKNYNIYHKMEYIAVKNESSLKKLKRKRTNRKSTPERSPSPEYSYTSESLNESE